jgi:aminocarboxymuconate-semialdehyde decarboxylase
MVFDPGLLAQLVAFAGADHVMLGTDYPFDMGEDDPLGLIGGAGLPEGDVDAIRGANAARLFSLD